MPYIFNHTVSNCAVSNRAVFNCFVFLTGYAHKNYSYSDTHQHYLCIFSYQISKIIKIGWELLSRILLLFFYSSLSKTEATVLHNFEVIRFIRYNKSLLNTLLEFDYTNFRTLTRTSRRVAREFLDAVTSESPFYLFYACILRFFCLRK